MSELSQEQKKAAERQQKVYNRMKEGSMYSLNDTVADSFTIRFRYKDVNAVSAAWALGDIAETDFTILYAIAVLGVAFLDDIICFLDYMKAWKTSSDDGPLIQNTSKDFMSGAMKRLFSNGLIYRYLYKTEGFGERTLYGIPNLAFTAMNARLGRNVKHLEFREMRPLSDIIGSSAAARIALLMMNSEHFVSYEDTTIFYSRACGTVQYDMEIKTEIAGQYNYVAIDHLFFRYDKNKMSKESYGEYIRNKVNWANEYVERRTKKGEAFVLFACQDFSDIALFSSVICESQNSNWMRNNEKIFFVSLSGINDCNSLKDNIFCVSEYHAYNTEDGSIEYRASGILTDTVPFL